MAITHSARWKVSLHLGGIAGSVTVFVPILLVLTPLVALVGWARWRVGAHRVAQAVVATILAVATTVGAFWVMGVSIAFPHMNIRMTSPPIRRATVPHLIGSLHPGDESLAYVRMRFPFA